MHVIEADAEFDFPVGFAGNPILPRSISKLPSSINRWKKRTIFHRLIDFTVKEDSCLRRSFLAYSFCCLFS